MVPGQRVFPLLDPQLLLVSQDRPTQSFIILEVLFQVPVFFLGVRGLWRGKTRSLAGVQRLHAQPLTQLSDRRRLHLASARGLRRVLEYDNVRVPRHGPDDAGHLGRTPLQAPRVLCSVLSDAARDGGGLLRPSDRPRDFLAGTESKGAVRGRRIPWRPLFCNRTTGNLSLRTISVVIK